jgi:hypothetical protein
VGCLRSRTQAHAGDILITIINVRVIIILVIIPFVIIITTPEIHNDNNKNRLGNDDGFHHVIYVERARSAVFRLLYLLYGPS